MLGALFMNHAFHDRIARLKSVALAACCLAACSDHPTAPIQMDGDAGPLCASCGGCEEVIDVTSAQHVSGPVDYPDPPPVGGPHSQCWGKWGVQDSELKPERWVHNLEHGGVVLLYHCDDGCPDDVDRLHSFVLNHRLTVLTAYSALPKRFAVVAWEHRLVSDCLDMTAVSRFYAALVGHGPEAVTSDPDPVCLERPEL
jgi:hypothetical protein